MISNINSNIEKSKNVNPNSTKIAQLENKIKEQKLNEEKMKEEVQSLKRQVKFYKDKIKIDLTEEKHQVNLLRLWIIKINLTTKT